MAGTAAAMVAAEREVDAVAVRAVVVRVEATAAEAAATAAEEELAADWAAG